MANSNFTPLGANVRWSRDDGLVQGGQQQPSSSASAAASGLFNASSLSDPFSNYGIQGEAIVKPVAQLGACRKCGFVGHLPFQCRNFIQLKPSHKTDIDISSTSSEDEYVTPLTDKKEIKMMKKLKKLKKKELKREKKMARKKKSKRSRSSRNSDSSDIDRKKRKHKEKEKDKR